MGTSSARQGPHEPPLPPSAVDRERGGGLRDGGEWVNWSGSVRFRPARVETPADEAAVARLVRAARREGRTLRVVAAGHSSSPVVRTDDILVSLERLQGVTSHDADAREATIRAGMSLHDAGEALLRRGLMMHNWGDVDYQTVAGAVATGTHGSGLRLPNLATMLVGGRLVTGEGDVVAFSIKDDPELVRALRCSLGALGILTEMRLRLEPRYRLRRQEWCATIDACLARLDEAAERYRMLDFYWYPRSDEVKIRVASRADDEMEPLGVGRLVKNQVGWANRVVPQPRLLKFEEMEYALPARAGVTAFAEVRERVKRVHRRTVGWRVLYRFVAPDDAYLSEAHGRETVTISCHHNAGLPFQDYFDDVEPVFRRHAGRPHWGKKHTLRARELAPLYPEWNAFRRARERLDPDGVLLSPYMRELLGVEP